MKALLLLLAWGVAFGGCAGGKTTARKDELGEPSTDSSPNYKDKPGVHDQAAADPDRKIWRQNTGTNYQF